LWFNGGKTSFGMSRATVERFLALCGIPPDSTSIFDGNGIDLAALFSLQFEFIYKLMQRDIERESTIQALTTAIDKLHADHETTKQSIPTASSKLDAVFSSKITSLGEILKNVAAISSAPPTTGSKSSTSSDAAALHYQRLADETQQIREKIPEIISQVTQTADSVRIFRDDIRAEMQILNENQMMLDTNIRSSITYIDQTKAVIDDLKLAADHCDLVHDQDKHILADLRADIASLTDKLASHISNIDAYNKTTDDSIVQFECDTVDSHMATDINNIYRRIAVIESRNLSPSGSSANSPTVLPPDSPDSGDDMRLSTFTTSILKKVTPLF
jgi:hypothetical protein